MLIFGFSVVVYNIVQVSYRQAICPPRLQGRMNSVMRFIVWGTIPLGTLAGGALGTWIGLRETIVVGAIGGGLAFLWILFSPQRHLREMPEPIDDDGAARAARSHRRYRQRPMPELPEVEAWVRELDPLVSRAPIERAGPAHIATLKTFAPPLADARRPPPRGRAAAREEPALPDRGRRARPPRPPDERRAGSATCAPGAKGPKTPMFRLRFAGGGELVLTEGREEEARRRLARHARAARRRPRAPRARRARARRRRRSREILRRERRQLHPLLRDQRAIAGIGRAHANEILLRARLSPFKASTELSDEEIERLATAIHEDLERALELRERGKGDRDVYRRPQPARRALPAVRDADRARRLRGAHDLLLPELPDRRAAAQGPAPLAPPALEGEASLAPTGRVLRWPRDRRRRSSRRTSRPRRPRSRSRSRAQASPACRRRCASGAATPRRSWPR